MPQHDPSAANRTVSFRFRKHQVQVILDRVLIFRTMRNLHGRFWGLAGINIMVLIFAVCFAIRPDLLVPSAAISDFGTDVRTAPYFAGAMFFASYGLWRWRNYLLRTLKRPRPVSWLVMLTIIGLYAVALMPISWWPVGYRIHMAGITLAGLSMVATVVADSLLSRTIGRTYAWFWRLSRFAAVVLIVIGGVITFGSAKVIGWYDSALIGEILMILGYSIWIYLKTYLGEGSRSRLSRLLKNVVLVD